MNKLRQETRQIICMVMNVIRDMPLRMDKDRPHSHGVRNFQIALFIFEHSAGLGGNAILCEDTCERILARLRFEISLFDPVICIKKSGLSSGGQNTFGMVL